MCMKDKWVHGKCAKMKKATSTVAKRFSENNINCGTRLRNIVI